MITTIQLRESVKTRLEQLKDTQKDTYEDVIVKLVSLAEIQKRKQKELLIEGCQEMANDSLEMTKEWSTVDKDWIW